MNKQISFKVLFIIIFSFIVISPLYSKSKVLLLTSGKNSIYEQVSSGFQSYMREQMSEVEVKTFEVDKRVGKTSKKIMDYYPEAIFALGTDALMMGESLIVFPCVYALILNPTKVQDLISNSPNVVGITEYIDPKVQIQKIKETYPQIKKVGTICGKNTKEVYDYLNAGNLDLQTVSYYVEDLSQVKVFFHKILEQKVDLFWFQKDITLLDWDIIKYQVLHCQKNNIKTLSFNPNHSELGIKMILSVDFYALGRQGAAIIGRILNGETPAEMTDEPIMVPKVIIQE